MKHTMKKMVDERISKESNALLAKLYWVALVLQIAVLIVKLYLQAEMLRWALDVLIILAGLGVMITLRTVRSLWGKKDEVLKEMDNSVLSTSFGAMMWIALLGTFLLTFGDRENSTWYAPSLAPVLIASGVYTVLAIRRGMVLWGGEKNRRDGKKRLGKATVLGALFFGIVMGAEDCFVDGAFRFHGLVKILIMGAGWGGFFYGLMSLVISRGEKAANKAVAATETGEEAEE
ncbi:MAG: hypothetical protein E7316_05180 [Clostridiales bacterium]|nr:hypothetical protein [Clostridiales bacterium]